MTKKSLFTYFMLATVAVSTLFVSCKKEIDTSFSKDFGNISFTVKATTAKGYFTIQAADISTAITQMAADKGFDVNKIKSAKIKSCTISINDTVTTVPKITFDAIDSVRASLSSSGLATVDIGTVVPAHNGSTSITLPTTSTDFVPYIKADKFSYSLWGKTNQAIPHDVPMKATMTFDITVTITK